MANPNASRTLRLKKDFIFVSTRFLREQVFRVSIANRPGKCLSASLPERQNAYGRTLKNITLRACGSVSFCSHRFRAGLRRRGKRPGLLATPAPTALSRLNVDGLTRFSMKIPEAVPGTEMGKPLIEGVPRLVPSGLTGFSGWPRLTGVWPCGQSPTK